MIKAPLDIGTTISTEATISEGESPDDCNECLEEAPKVRRRTILRLVRLMVGFVVLSRSFGEMTICLISSAATAMGKVAMQPYTMNNRIETSIADAKLVDRVRREGELSSMVVRDRSRSPTPIPSQRCLTE